MTIAETEVSLDTCILDVTGGQHKGASVTFGSQGCSIGTDPTCDIILGDTGIAERHLKLIPDGRGLRVETGGDSAVVGKTRIPAGHGLKTAFPAEFRLGEATFRVSRIEDRRDSRFLSSSAKWVACGVAAAVVAVASVQAVAGVGTVGMNAALVSQKPIDPVRKKPASKTIGEASAALSLELSKYGLNTLNIRPDGSLVVVSGSLASDRQPQWHAIQEWFDGTYGSQFVLSNLVSVQVPSKPDITLQAVWLGQEPYVVIGGGRRVHPGESIGNGWVMTSIASGKVEFKRSGESFLLPF